MTDSEAIGREHYERHVVRRAAGPIPATHWDDLSAETQAFFIDIAGLELAGEADNVNRPAHYTAGSIECIDAIRAALTPEEFRGYCKGNVIKYVWRERLKGGNESLAKCEPYLRWAQE